MEQKTVAELCAELNVDPSFVEATIGLDTGRLLKNEPTYISSRHEWVVGKLLEQTTLSDLSKVEKSLVLWAIPSCFIPSLVAGCARGL